MRFHYETALSSDRETLWEFLMKVDNVAACLEEVKSVEALDEDHYEGLLQVKLGPVSFNFQCAVCVEMRDKMNWQGKLKTDAKDKRLGGGFQSYLTLNLREISPHKTHLQLDLESTILGKIGEYGQPLIRKRIDRMFDGFIKKVKETVC